MLPNPFKQAQQNDFGGGRNFGGERGRGNNRRGRGGRTNNRGGGRGSWKNKHTTRDEFSRKKEWGNIKFNPIAKDAREDMATPWSKYKTELIQKQCEEEGSKVNVNGAEAKEFLKKREENYRRLLITQKQKEPTKWEDFSDDNEDEQEKPLIASANEDKLRKKKQKQNKNQAATDVNSSTEKLFINKEVLQNFDSKKLNFVQKNTLRKVITKTLHTARGFRLKDAVKDLKRKQYLEKFKTTKNNK